MSGYMMQCNECQHVFDEDDGGTHEESERLSGRGTVYWTVLTCPECGSDNVSQYEPTEDEEE